MYYWSRLSVGDFKSGDRYEDLEQTYSVNVLGFTCLKNKNYHSEISLLEKQCYENPSDVLSIHIFELPKVPVELLRDDPAQDWMRIIKADSEEMLESIRTRTGDPMIKKAIDAICTLNADERLREQIRVQEKALLDYGSGIADAEARGRAEGRAEACFDIVENMRRNGFSEEQIKLVVGEGYKG